MARIGVAGPDMAQDVDAVSLNVMESRWREQLKGFEWDG